MSKAPSIEDLKSLQAARGWQDRHVVWIGPEHFVIAHTDHERSTIDLSSCPLHKWLSVQDGPPKKPGYYAVSGQDWEPIDAVL